jgi:hypothetical protein
MLVMAFEKTLKDTLEGKTIAAVRYSCDLSLLEIKLEDGITVRVIFSVADKKIALVVEQLHRDYYEIDA